MSYINLSEIGFGDTQSIDAFGRLRVSQSTTLFDSQQEYGLNTYSIWDATANGVMASPSSTASVISGSNAVGPRDVNTRMTPITVSTTDAHYSILQSRTYLRYIPGKSHLVFMTGVFASGPSASAAFVRRSSTSGSVVDESINQASWNIDKLDGSGPSGEILDLTKTQILFISAQWIGVGRVIIGFDIAGVLYPAHQFLHANVLSVPYTQTFNLPVRYELRNTSASSSVSRCGYFDESNGIFLAATRSAAGGTIHACCCSVQSEAGEEQRGFLRTASNGIASIAVTTRRPVLSIRPKTTYNGITNRAHVDISEYTFRATTNDAFFELVVGGTLTGGSFTSAATNSVVEYDVAATSISGGTVISSGFAISGSGNKAALVDGTADPRSPLTLRQIDGLTATQEALTLVCTSITGISNINAALSWHEQVV